jgi:hypothetical protein
MMIHRLRGPRRTLVTATVAGALAVTALGVVVRTDARADATGSGTAQQRDVRLYDRPLVVDRQHPP